MEHPAEKSEHQKRNRLITYLGLISVLAILVVFAFIGVPADEIAKEKEEPKYSIDQLLIVKQVDKKFIIVNNDSNKLFAQTPDSNYEIIRKDGSYIPPATTGYLLIAGDIKSNEVKKVKLKGKKKKKKKSKKEKVEKYFLALPSQKTYNLRTRATKVLFLTNQKKNSAKAKKANITQDGRITAPNTGKSNDGYFLFEYTKDSLLFLKPKTDLDKVLISWDVNTFSDINELRAALKLEDNTELEPKDYAGQASCSEDQYYCQNNLNLTSETDATQGVCKGFCGCVTDDGCFEDESCTNEPVKEFPIELKRCVKKSDLIDCMKLGVCQIQENKENEAKQGATPKYSHNLNDLDADTVNQKDTLASADSRADTAPGERSAGCHLVVGTGNFKPSIVPGDPTMATADAQYASFAGGYVRLSHGTAIVSFGGTSVGQVATLAVDSRTPQSILAGYAHSTQEAIGLVIPRVTTKTSATATTSQALGGTLYIGGLGFPQAAKGYGGFEWEPTMSNNGQRAVRVTGAGSLNSALLVFGKPNIVGYHRIEKIVFAQGVTITYQYMDRWNVAITLNDPTKGSIVMRYSQQPSQDSSTILVLKTMELGNTVFELEQFTFKHIAPYTLALSEIKNLNNGATYALTWREDLRPAQWGSAAHAENDNAMNRDAIPVLKSVTGSASINFYGPGGLQQVPGTTPWYTHNIQEARVNGRQFLTGNQSLDRKMFTPAVGGVLGASIQVGETFVEHTNQKSENGSVARLYNEQWSAQTQSWPMETTIRGARNTFKYNDVGAITEETLFFRTNQSWVSKYVRDGYWIKSASLYNGTEFKLVGDPKNPTSFSVKTPLGTYQVSMTWQEHTVNDLTQKLLTSYTQVAPSGVKTSSFFTWKGDHLVSISYNNGTSTSITPTSMTSYSADGAERVRLALEQRFDSFRYADPHGFNGTSTLSSGILKSAFYLNADLIRQQSTAYGSGTTQQGGFTTKNSFGSGQGAGGYTSQSSTVKEGFGMMSLNTDSSGNSQGHEGQGPHSVMKPVGSCKLNDVTIQEGACNVQFRTSKPAKLTWPRPGLGIDNASITKEKDNYYLNLLVSNNAFDEAKVLLVNSCALGSLGISADLDLFSIAGGGALCSPYASLEGLKKAFALPCRVERSVGDIPYLLKCQIPKEDACGCALTVVLAAGVPCSGSTEPTTGYVGPPQFCKNGNIDGFSGVMSNQFTALPVPGTCS